MFRRLAAFILLWSFSVVLTPKVQSQDAAGLFDKGMNAIRGSGVTRNDRDAIDSFRRSAEMGYVPAQTVLGYMYNTGFIVAKEPRKAAEWYHKAAQQGDVLGQWLLGRVLFLGGVPPFDLNDAINWLQRAADAGNPFGQYILALIRVQKNDYGKAAELLQKASEQGLPQAQYELGKLLLEGHSGVPRDKYEAYIWLLMAADANYAQHPELQTVESDLGSRKEEAKATARQRERDYARSVIARGCTGWQGEFDRIPNPPPPDMQQFCR